MTSMRTPNSPESRRSFPQAYSETSQTYREIDLDIRTHRNFQSRHVGPSPAEVSEMLKALKLTSLQALVEETVPAKIMSRGPLDLAEALSESEVLGKARRYAGQNQVMKSFIGMGYYGTHTPSVILRNITENPAWYTAYTPYQAEISQGRLEALLNFQTMVMDLTAMPVANASLLDEGTAVAEAIHLSQSVTKNQNATRVLISEDCLPQTIEVIRRRAEPLGIDIVIQNHRDFAFDDRVFAVVVQYPGANGEINDFTELASRAHAAQASVICAADLLALTMLKAPGDWGADIVVGSTQRFGVPMGFGGPHAAYMATRDEFKRNLPGRLVGVSIDANGNPALRLALQTREQHIRRERATSNICTAQVLLAVMASMYGVYHGPEGLKKIAGRTHRLAMIFAEGLKKISLNVTTQNFFDTVTIELKADEAASALKRAVNDYGSNLRAISATQLGISFDETSTRTDVENLWTVFAKATGRALLLDFDNVDKESLEIIPASLRRQTEFMKHPVFNSYHSETEMLRYMYRLQAKDFSLVHSMIPLGSCTMKLNASTEMIPITWPEFNQLHPYQPREQTRGSLAMIHELEGFLREITGFDAISLQPNAGSAGEYAGLLAIRDYHHSRKQGHRNICLIPTSAHGTNPASAVMAGMTVVGVKCDDQGNVDVPDLRARAIEHADKLAALMVTYPSTHGVFEESIKEISEIVHAQGGQVYMDGANFNALVGLCRPGEFGPDVCHLNLHKTFCIPHGGGGPGVGPIGVKAHLTDFLPTEKPGDHRPGPVASAPYGSASILPISWAYISLMGRDGLKAATEVAILNANYMAARLEGHYPILYKGRHGRVAHECIIDLRPLKAASGVDVEDVAKRLQDYGFHAPTMSWPVPGTLMIEPTESESKAELDRFCEAMIAIREEIRELESPTANRENNVLKRAPHTVMEIVSDSWDRPYSREKAAFPKPWVRERKFWPSVARINNPYGDRHFICSCPAVELPPEKN